MKNAPKKIFLVVGGRADEDDIADFRELTEVSWADAPIFDNDIEYIRKDIVDKMLKENQ